MLSPPVDSKVAYDSTELLTAAAGPSAAPSTHSSPLEDTHTPRYTERAFENLYFPPGGEEPPPEFTPYEAEFFISGKEIVSHDPHLNEDGEYSFPAVSVP